MRRVEGFLRTHPVVLAAVAIAAGLGLLVVVIKLAPEWLASTDGLTANERAEEIGRVRTALLATLAGGIAVFGAVYTARTFALNRQGQITDRFTKAVDQLGHAELDVRLGGIYGLERIARESRSDHGPIVEILTAYVREHAPSGSTGDAWSEQLTLPTEKRRPERPPTDVQAILTVLSRRTLDHEGNRPPRLGLQRTRLRGAQFPPSAHFERTDFTEAILDGAILVAPRLQDASFLLASLEGTKLPAANLERADLSFAKLDGETDFGYAHLEGTDLKFVQNPELANWEGARFDEHTQWPESFDPADHGMTQVNA